MIKVPSFDYVTTTQQLYMTTEQNPSTDEEQEIWFKAPENENVSELYVMI